MGQCLAKSKKQYKGNISQGLALDSSEELEVMHRHTPLHSVQVINNNLICYLDQLEDEQVISNEKKQDILEKLNKLTNYSELKNLLSDDRIPHKLKEKLKESLSQAGLDYLVRYVTKPPPVTEASRIKEVRALLSHHYKSTKIETAWYPGSQCTPLQMLKIYNDADNTELHSYQQMFQFVTPPVRILLYGELGVGKSTMLHMITADWAKSVYSTEQEDESSVNDNTGMNMYDIVLHLDLGMVCGEAPTDDACSILGQIIKSQLVFLGAEDRLFLVKYITKYPERVLLLMDDADHCQSKQLNKIIEGLVLDKCACLFTSQNYFLPGHNPERDMCCIWRYNLRGFTNGQAVNFIEHFIADSYPENERKIFLSDILNQIGIDYNRDSEQLAPPLIRIPSFLHTTCKVWEKHQKVPSSWSSCFETLLKQMLLLYENRCSKLENEDTLLKQHNSELLELGELAFDSIKSPVVPLTYRKKDLQEQYHLSNKVLELGILVGQNNNLPAESDTHVTFLHKFLLQYLAALYLTSDTENSSADQEEAFFSTCTDLDGIIRNKFTFFATCCLSPDKGNSMIQRCIEIFKEKASSLQSTLVTEFLVSCLNEYKTTRSASFTLPPILTFQVNDDCLSKQEALCKLNKKPAVVQLHVYLSGKILDEKIVEKLVLSTASPSMLSLDVECEESMTHDAYKTLYKAVKLMKNLRSFSLKIHQPHKNNCFFRSLLSNLSELQQLANININIK